MTSPAVCEAAGITYRQLDYWIRKGAIPTSSEMLGHGSGTRRQIPDRYVDRLELLGRLTHAAGHTRIPTALLRAVFDNYDNGRVELAPGIHLTWTPKKDQP